MALAPRISNVAANAACDAVVDLLDGGYLRIYDGSQPATVDTAITTQTLLAELAFGTPAFGSAANGVATANAITADSSANNSGTATWFRCFKSDGTTAVMDGSVDTATANLILTNTAITAGGVVTVNALTYTQNKT